MNWDAATAIAEWVGVIVVVVTLVYVAMEIRHNTASVRAATELETGREWAQFHARVAHSGDMADIWDKGLTRPESLSPTEKRRFIWLIAEYGFLVENLFRQWRMGFLSDTSWSTHLATVAGLLTHPVARSWWNSGVSPYSREFRDEVNTAVNELGDVAWSYTPLSEL